MSNVVRIEMAPYEGESKTYTAVAYVGTEMVAWATEVRPERAIRECMNEARRVVRSDGPLRFELPYAGKKFHVPWWEKRTRVPLREMAQLRKKGNATETRPAAPAPEATKGPILAQGVASPVHHVQLRDILLGIAIDGDEGGTREPVDLVIDGGAALAVNGGLK